MTFHSFDTTKSNAGAGVIIGWQGHTDFAGQPRFGHPYGGLCGFGRSVAEPAPPRLELIRNNGDNADTVVAARTHRGRSASDRGTDALPAVDLGNGNSRYSCKFWRARAEPPPGTCR